MLKLVILADSTHLICECEETNDPLVLKLGLTAVVRIWGTTKGRGQLCFTGPVKGKTICDKEPPGGEVNWLQIRRTIPVTKEAERKWMDFLRETE